MYMKLLLIAISFFFFYSCKNKETERHTLKKPVSALFSSNDSLSRIFYDKEFLSTLDTLKVEGKELPIKLSLINYYAGSAYTVSNSKLLLATYTDICRLYFFKLNANNKWQLMRVSETSAQELGGIENSIRDAIKKDQIQLKNHSDDYKVGDIVRYSSKSWNGNKGVSVTTLEKPGYSLFDILNDIELGK